MSRRLCKYPDTLGAPLRAATRSSPRVKIVSQRVPALLNQLVTVYRCDSAEPANATAFGGLEKRRSAV